VEAKLQKKLSCTKKKHNQTAQFVDMFQTN